MDLQEIERIVGEAVRDADLQPWEIPGIDLYMDQITNLLADKRREGAEHYRDRELTKTMINNYSKDGLISPVKGKKYTKEQILQMLTVYELKNTLSIGEIKTLLQGLYGQPDYDAKMLEEIYGRYLEIKELQRRSAWEFLQTCIEKSELDPTRQTDFFLLLLGMSSASAYLKSGVQLLLEGIAPSDTDEESAEEPRDKAEEKAAEKSRRKAEKKAKKEEKAAAKSGEKSHAEATAEDREETAHETE